MDKILNNSLVQLGLTSKEIKFFKACFEGGPCTINEVARRARLERSTSYLIAQELLSKGFIKEDLKPYKKTIFTVEPKELLRMISAKQRVLRRQELEIEENLPGLQSVYQASEIRPKVKVFEGNKGLLAIWRDILSAKGEMLLWTNQETENLFFTKELHQKFVQERVRKKIFIRVLAVGNQKGKGLVKLESNLLRETRLLPPGVDFSPETYVYDNKIAVLDYNKDIIGVITESEPITASQKSIFEMVWQSLSKP